MLISVNLSSSHSRSFQVTTSTQSSEIVSFVLTALRNLLLWFLNIFDREIQHFLDEIHSESRHSIEKMKELKEHYVLFERTIINNNDVRCSRWKMNERRTSITQSILLRVNETRIVSSIINQSTSKLTRKSRIDQKNMRKLLNRTL
jgi:hypothetical protein